MSEYLLILSCSDQKVRNNGLIPAIDLYNGVNYKVIHKLKKENKLSKNLDTVIISAKYGFLRSNDFIEYYDHLLTKERALELKSDVINGLKEFLKDKNYAEIFVNLGKIYLLAVDGFEDFVSKETKITYAKGRIGERMAKMKEWLLNIKENSETKHIG